MLDLAALSAAQIEQAEAVFGEFAARGFLPAHQACRDETRRDLDRAALIGLLGLDEEVLEPLAVLREQWRSEPSVHGGKRDRRKGLSSQKSRTAAASSFQVRVRGV